MSVSYISPVAGRCIPGRLGGVAGAMLGIKFEGKGVKDHNPQHRRNANGEWRVSSLGWIDFDEAERQRAQRIMALFQERENLYYRAHSAFRGACGMSMAGQVYESYVLGRSVLEAAGYALHINDTPSLAQIWWDRNQSDAEKKQMIRMFSLGEIGKSIEKRDHKLAGVFSLLYERSIDFGGHPNQRAIAGNMQIEEEPDKINIIQAFLHGDGMPMNAALKNTAQVGICALRLAQFMMPAKFMLLGVREGILAAEQGL